MSLLSLYRPSPNSEKKNCNFCIIFSCKLAFVLFILARVLAFVKDKCYNVKHNVTVIIQRRDTYDFPEL